ncbi:hypothetical protein C3489_19475 [Streptomyces sp. Ru71]|uniref:hypothetical protein n=1 Tax=Streptomyces sp. Ru71 TaxID=2080746 RepID=UPI000CDD3E4B|nr:hypothetical protein [Streptomyces sp. Ru71]POX51654.1 hypothetical protein C3489_19475 [Streptomyces sp. Ru71]
MSGGGRAVLAATGLVIAVFAGALSFLSWERANQVAGVASALFGVAALGLSVHTLLAPARGAAAVRVSGTGKATANGGGDANTGFVSATPGAAPGEVSVDGTGDAQADGGSANTGFRQD